MKWKILWIQLSVFLSTFAFTITTYAEESCGGDNSVCNIPNTIYRELERDNVFTSIARLIGRWIYWIFSTLLDAVTGAFTNLIKFDFLHDESGKTNSLPSMLSEVMKNIDMVLYAVLFICFVVVVVIRLMKLENNFKTIYNAFMVVMAVTLFSTLFTMMNTAKNDMVDVTKSAFGGEDLTPSKQILIDNTYDFKQSVIDGELKTLRDTDFDVKYLDYFDTEVRLLKDGEGGLKDFWYVDMTDNNLDKDNKKTLKDLNGGFFGIGEESYYRFKPNWLNINLICLVMIVIYSMAIFKLGYLLWNWMSFYVFGQFAMGKGIWDISHIGRTLKQGAMTALGFIMLYASMNLYTIMGTGILNMADSEVNPFGKAVLLFSIGMAIISGSGFLNDFLGIDDGSGAMLRNLFVARSLARLGGGAVRGAGKVAKAGFKGAKATGKGMYNLSQKMGDLENEADQVNKAPETYTSRYDDNKSYSANPRPVDDQDRHYEDGKFYEATKAMKDQKFNQDQIVKDSYASHEATSKNQSYSFDSSKEDTLGSTQQTYDWKPSENVQSKSYNEGNSSCTLDPSNDTSGQDRVFSESKTYADSINEKQSFDQSQSLNDGYGSSETMTSHQSYTAPSTQPSEKSFSKPQTFESKPVSKETGSFEKTVMTKKQKIFEEKMNHSKVVAPSQGMKKKVFGIDHPKQNQKSKIIQTEKPKVEKRTFAETQNEFMNTVQMALQKDQKKND